MTAPQAEASWKKAASALSPITADQMAQTFMVNQHTQAPVATSLTFDTTNYVPATAYNAATLSSSGSGGAFAR